jgi:transcriptional regulator with XRE-family HTH domain
MDTGPQAFAAYVRRHALAAGYDLDAFGEQARLARDAQLDKPALTRILSGERVPQKAATLWPLAQAIRRPLVELLATAGIIPAESVANEHAAPVVSQPITADALADEWGVTTAKGRELVRDMLDRVRLIAQQTPDEPEQGSRASG